MKFRTFKGGIHPNDKKELTNNIPVTRHIPLDEIIVPLRQHIGVPCEPLVGVGDYVYMGQKIGESQSFVSAPVHSSVSGTVTAIKPHPHPGGGEAMCVFIKNDYEDKLDPSIKPFDLELSTKTVREYVAAIEPEEIVKKVRESGITGMGGAAFPLHVKLSPPKDCKIDTILINGAECEPYLTSDHRAMLERPQLIITGTLLVAKAVNAQKIIIAIESNKPDAIKLFENMTEEFPEITIGVLKTKYPQGSEKQLIQAVTKRQVPSGGLPANVGLLVTNIDTCSAVTRAVVMNMPLIERNVTVSGDAVTNPKNLLARVGVTFGQLFDACGGFKEEPRKIVMGGPMMGISQCTTDVPVIKGTSGILAFTEPETYGKEEGTCIKCSKCVDVCPMRLMPNALSIFSRMEKVDKLNDYHVMDCMECGSCTYICPQRRFIVQHIKHGKTVVKNSQQKGI